MTPWLLSLIGMVVAIPLAVINFLILLALADRMGGKSGDGGRAGKCDFGKIAEAADVWDSE